MDYEQSFGGINSLRGFSFQIKVFIYFLADLAEGNYLEFETIEDVNIKKITPDTIDENSEYFRTKLKIWEENYAIQVKRTEITKTLVKKVLLNWILLESSGVNISKYSLFTETDCNQQIIFEEDMKVLFDEIMDSDQKVTSTITKVKNLYQGRFEEFEEVVKRIKEKHEILTMKDLDREILEKYKNHFRKAANEVVFGQRMFELYQEITAKIMNAVERKKGLSIDYKEFICRLEDISERFTETVTYPEYSNFKKINQVELLDDKILKSREYKQLLACKLDDKALKEHLIYRNYYTHNRTMLMEMNKGSTIENLEQTTFSNFNDVKIVLQLDHKDIPVKRLIETKKRENSYAKNEQVRWGSGIYLTREGEEENQISWRDDEDESLKKGD